MLVHPEFDPIAFHVGPIAVRWYGLMYLRRRSCCSSCWASMRARQNLLTGWHPRDVDDMLFYGVFGVILGGRLGYVLFYKPLYYLAHPLEILPVWQGGMSFHGGFLGVLVALWFFARVARQALARRHRLRRAAGAAGPRRRAARQLHQRRAVGARRPTCRGRWCSRRRDPRRAIRRSSTSSRSRACCCSCCCGLHAPARGRWARCRACSWSATARCRFVAEYAREPDSFLGLSRARPDDGAVAVAADDRGRRRDDALGVPARRQGAADGARPDEVSVSAPRRERVSCRVSRCGGSRRRSPCGGRRERAGRRGVRREVAADVERQREQHERHHVADDARQQEQQRRPAPCGRCRAARAAAAARRACAATVLRAERECARCAAGRARR